MRFTRALLGAVLATFVAAAPSVLRARDDLPPGCPEYCDCSQYTDPEE